MKPKRLLATAALTMAAILAAGSGGLASADHDEEGSKTAPPPLTLDLDDPLSAYLILLVPALDSASDEARNGEGCNLNELLGSLALDSTVAGGSEAPETQLGPRRL